MSVILQDTLKSLCHKNGWCYAVFWKLKRRGRMLLTWEDGYYEFAKSSFAPNDYSSIESLFEKNETVGSSHDYDICGQQLHSTKDKIGLAVAKMSYQIYSLGEGVVGRVAFTGKHQWVIRQKNCIDKSNSTSMLTGQMLECPAGWQNQFDCGIKTIAVVAVVPHGVVQLGSMQTIMEDVEFISHIRNVFGTLQNIPGAFLPDRLQEPLKRKIQGSVFPSFSTKPTTSGDPYQMQISNTNYFQDHLNTSDLKIQDPNILDGFGDHFGISEMDKKTQAKPCLVSSQNISSPSIEISNQHSDLQQEDENMNSFSCAVTIGLGTKIEETGVLEMETVSPFQEILEINKSLADTQCAPFTGLGIRNKNLGVMEEHLQMPGTSTAVQYQSSNNMLASLHEISTLNSNIYQVESKIERELSEISGEELHGEAMVAVRTSSVDVLQQNNILTPFSALQYAPSQSESSPSLSLIPFINKSTGINTSPLPKVEMNVDSVYRYSTIYSDCIQNCVFDCEDKFRSSMTSHISVGSSDLLDSLLLTFEPGRIEQQHWIEESGQTYEAVFSEDGLVETLNYAEGSFEDLETCTQNLLAIRYDHCDPSEDAPSDCKVLKSVIRDQNNLQNAVSKPFKMDKAFQTSESALVTKTDTDAWDKNLLSERKIPELHRLPQLYGISSDSTCHSVVTQFVSPSVDTDMEGGLSYETNSENLLDSVVGNLYSRENYGADDNASNKMTSSGLSTMGSLCSPSVRTDTCLVGQADGLKQTDFIFSEPSQCMLDKGNLENFCNFDNVLPVKQDHTDKEKLTNESPSITHMNSGIDDCESSRCEDSMISQSKTSSSMVNRKRSRSSESGKPRPKDRQQIQDRVKELREIIPNGVKCSIDSLLERTIKHMIFLQTVTKHAENLNQSCEKKVFDKDNHILGRDFLEGGSSWALELCGQSMGCPIIVEELIQHRQMIVKMICEEQGLFLEIADIIRGLGLTILKGSMEVCNEKIWSHFIVEANQDVHRMEVLWSLVQLLQPDSKNGSITCIQPVSLRSQGTDNNFQSYNML